MIPISKPSLGKEERELLLKAYDSGWISSKGSFIKLFEEDLAKFNDVKETIVSSNGTAALHLALLSLEIGKGDEVIVPNSTFAATVNSVIYCGAKPVFVDVNEDNFCLNDELLQEHINEKTKAIIPVHIYGYPMNLDELLSISKENNIVIIEDAAEAIGASYKGKMVGSFGQIGTFSFYGNKIITTGEGGACITSNTDLARKMRIFRDHGMDPNHRYNHKLIGYNYRMTNLQAAIGVAQLSKIDMFLKRRKEIYKLYKDELSEIKYVKLQSEPKNGQHAYWMISGLFDKKDDLEVYLAKNNVETRPFFIPLNEMLPYKKYAFYSSKKNISKEIWKRGLCLPTFNDLSDEDIKYITQLIKNFYRNI